MKKRAVYQFEDIPRFTVTGTCDCGNKIKVNIETVWEFNEIVKGTKGVICEKCGKEVKRKL